MTRTSIYIQDACYQHQYIRHKDTSAIVERPERIYAVKAGLAAGIARLDDIRVKQEALDNKQALDPSKREATPDETDDLVAAMNRVTLTNNAQFSSPHVSVIHSTASVDILNNPSVKFIHGDIEGDVYLEKLKSWIAGSRDRIGKEGTEIPDGLSQGDLYLCPESLQAIQGALGTVCEAVDGVIEASKAPSSSSGSAKSAFVVVRPPGHHCGEDTPSGFCFVNNVAVAAAHAHLNHDVNRIVIFDIDLHHGNGTQSIIWQINEETYRQTLEPDEVKSAKVGPKVYYGSIHDILSYPCEDGKPQLVQAASTSVRGAHGQYIENIHLQEYKSQEDFWDNLYPRQYSQILQRAAEFLDSTGGPGDDVLFFISCGMDACEHEYESMSRHNRKVPTSFYYRFTRDACQMSEKYGKGKLISVLEGGYSDRALISGSMSHLCGLVGHDESVTVDEAWWSVQNLENIEKATKKRRGGRVSLPAPGSVEPWLERLSSILGHLEPNVMPRIPVANAAPAPPVMTLRERKKPTPASSPSMKSKATPKSRKADPEPAVTSKPLPRVILRLGPRPGEDEGQN